MPNTIFKNQVMTSEGAELLENARLNTVKHVYKDDNTEVTTSGHFVMTESSGALAFAKIDDGVSFVCARVEYTAE